MARRRTATITVEPRVIVVTGWQVGRILHSNGLRAIYAGTRQGWVLDAHRLPDALAALQHNGFEVTVSEEAGTL